MRALGWRLSFVFCFVPHAGYSQSVLEDVLAAWNGPNLKGIFINASSSLSTGLDGLQFDAASFGVDGTITNIISGAVPDNGADGVIGALNNSGSIGDFSATTIEATGIGGVTTGLIDINQIDATMPNISTGSNAALQAAAAGTALARSAQSDVPGGSLESASLSLNIASNGVAVRGSVEMVLTRVNAVVGPVRATGIGVVNTGVIQSGLDAIVADLVGRSPS